MSKSLKTGKMKNGHKLFCVCHICENMKNKAKRGGYEDEAEREAIQQAGGSGKKNGPTFENISVHTEVFHVLWYFWCFLQENSEAKNT